MFLLLTLRIMMNFTIIVAYQKGKRSQNNKKINLLVRRSIIINVFYFFLKKSAFTTIDPTKTITEIIA